MKETDLCVYCGLDVDEYSGDTCDECLYHMLEWDE